MTWKPTATSGGCEALSGCSCGCRFHVLISGSAIQHFSMFLLQSEVCVCARYAQECREAYKFFLLLFIAWQVTAEDTERHNICVSHSEAAVEAHTSHWGKSRAVEGECCALISKGCEMALSTKGAMLASYLAVQLQFGGLWNL